MDLATLLKETRKSNNLTQDEFSKKLNITRGTLSHLERGRAPSIETSKKLEEYFKQPISELIGNKKVDKLLSLETTNMLIDLLIKDGEIRDDGSISEYAKKSIWNNIKIEIALKLEQKKR
ncbi:helix-turn-helix transcriptional regulator [Clostridium perfringens]|uniref:DNA-binding helix-turn-helix protein n=1 Tax=Clostridium perfringens TaxID=1502 RepID=A0A133MNF8_CLOPF|nr:helix-turn-helix domain-containing protein [Clostridium perfringens]ELU5587468.1 helix-turn-helix transcriptional regulator [Clostridium perfringens]KXA05555.1 DNA-binding helix-turn-helix protein [Clostridium perfringens]